MNNQHDDNQEQQYNPYLDTFIKDSAEKKMVARNAKHRASRKKGFKGKITFPSDFLKGKEKKLYTNLLNNGKAVTYNMYDTIISYQDFLLLDSENRKKHLEEYCSRFPTSTIASFWNVKRETLYNLRSRYAIKGVKYNADAIDELNAISNSPSVSIDNTTVPTASFVMPNNIIPNNIIPNNGIPNPTVTYDAQPVNPQQFDFDAIKQSVAYITQILSSYQNILTSDFSKLVGSVDTNNATLASAISSLHTLNNNYLATLDTIKSINTQKPPDVPTLNINLSGSYSGKDLSDKLLNISTFISTSECAIINLQLDIHNAPPSP